MSDRARLDAELENLERMISDWRGTLRHEAQFGAQFEALAQEIMARTDVVDREYAQARIDRMLAAHLPAGKNPE